jgi:hypothetical protein
MPIRVVCKCGRTLNAPDDAAGKQGKCPSCGNRLLIVAAEEPVLLTQAPQEMPLGVTLELGNVTCTYARLGFTFHIDRAQCAYVEIVANSSYDDGDDSQIVLGRLDDARYEQLVDAMKTTQETVKKYRISGPERRMVEVFGIRASR